MTLRKGFSTLTIALLVSLLGLGLAVSSVSKLTGSQRETTTNVQRTDAINCVESAIELAIGCIQTATVVLVECQQPTNATIDSDDLGACEYRYSVTGVTDYMLIPQISLDKTEIFALNPAGSTSVDIAWKTDFDDGNALEFNLLNDNGGGYDLEQVIYTCELSSGTIDSGTGISVESASYDSVEKECSVSGGLSLSGESYLQITSRFSDSYNVDVTINGDVAPLQGYNIEAVGIAGQVERYGNALFLNSNFGRVINAAFMADQVE